MDYNVRHWDNMRAVNVSFRESRSVSWRDLLSSPLKLGVNRREGERTPTPGEWELRAVAKTLCLLCSWRSRAKSLEFNVWLAHTHPRLWSWSRRSAVIASPLTMKKEWSRTKWGDNSRALLSLALLCNLHTVHINSASLYRRRNQQRSSLHGHGGRLNIIEAVKLGVS